MQADCNSVRLRFQAFKGRSVSACFDGRHITSDAGGLLLREIEDGQQFSDGPRDQLELPACLSVADDLRVHMRFCRRSSPERARRGRSCIAVARGCMPPIPAAAVFALPGGAHLSRGTRFRLIPEDPGAPAGSIPGYRYRPRAVVLPCTRLSSRSAASAAPSRLPSISARARARVR